MSKRILISTLLIGLLSVIKLYGQSIHLVLEGENELETITIDSIGYKKQFKDYNSLNDEVNFIKNKFQKIGFLESKLLFIRKENDSTYLAKYHLNQRFSTIKIYYKNFYIDKNLLNAVVDIIEDDYFEVKIENLESTLEILNTEISEQGDPFSTLQLTDITKTKDNSLIAGLVINENSQRTIDKIIVKGYEAFPKSFIKRYLRIKPNQTFSLTTIKKKTSNLENLRFARQIKDPEVLFTKDSTILYIYLEKVTSNSFDGFLGFGTNEETNKIEFDGYLNLNLTNNLNYGESLRILYKSDQSEQRTFDIRAELPYLFKTPIGIDLGLNIFRKDSTFSIASQSIKIAYQIDAKNKIGVGINSTTSTNLLDVSSAFIDDYNSNFYIVNYFHQSPQAYDILFPINFLFDFTAGFGNRTFQNIDESQSRFVLNAYKIFNLNSKNSIYTRLNGAVLTSDNYLENELFRFGGINSIRGFEENSLIADLFSVINTEYRYRVSNSLYIHTVFDAAYFENKIAESKTKLFGFGFGFGLFTKAGLFRFNYAGGKTENQKFKFSDSKIHISLTANF